LIQRFIFDTISFMKRASGKAKIDTKPKPAKLKLPSEKPARLKSVKREIKQSKKAAPAVKTKNLKTAAEKKALGKNAGSIKKDAMKQKVPQKKTVVKPKPAKSEGAKNSQVKRTVAPTNKNKTVETPKTAASKTRKAAAVLDSAVKNKSARKNSSSVVKAEKSKQKNASVKIAAKTAAQTTAAKSLTQSKKSDRKISAKAKTIKRETVKPATKKPAQPELSKTKKSQVVKITRAIKKDEKESRPKQKAAAKTVKNVAKTSVKNNIKTALAIMKTATKNTRSGKKTVAEISKIQAVSAEAAKPRKKAVRPISSAVFRGKKSQYDFKVFSLDEKFEAVEAVYIISRRVTDRRKRGHHKLVCIGQTDSVIESIKKHKKDKCIRQNEANVICLLKESDEKNRLRIEADLREAHAISCNRV
jgi:hypothetical protein